MKILFEDESVLVCYKPAGILSQKASDGEESAVSILEKHTGAAVYPVHRLDRGTAGLMMFAKTALAAANLSRQIAGHSFVKEYLALIYGNIPEKDGKWSDLLFYDRRRGKSYIVDRERAGVKTAILRYSVLQEGFLGDRAVSLVKITLETGRTHQIRAQFAFRQLPLVGDNRYGASDHEKQIALRSCKIAFEHPITGEPMQFSLPEYFEEYKL